MKTKISAYWPLAVAITLASLAAAQAYGNKPWQKPLTAARVSAELARAVSYGLVDAPVVQNTSSTQGV
jgi:hypothetical protein